MTGQSQDITTPYYLSYDLHSNARVPNMCPRDLVMARNARYCAGLLGNYPTFANGFTLLTMGLHQIAWTLGVSGVCGNVARLLWGHKL